ncbi:MAG TPA: hypothetical protein VG964_00050 [Candidatus Saccharimonadales bacterium]|nr:hypothetical protein [Candidatus Saccharimonadales bacterium]
MKKQQISKYELNLQVLIKREGDVFVAYTPALDIATFGKTESKAKKSFNELVSTFFEEFLDSPRELEEVLTLQGWQKQKNTWQPPVVTNITQNVQVNMAV